MKITDKGKYLAIAISFPILVGLAIIFRVRSIFCHMAILILSVYAIYFLKLKPIKGEISKLVLLMCGVFMVNLILSYYFRFVAVGPSEPNVMRYISLSPMIIGLVVAPIIEELGFRRVLLGALLKAEVHWFVACTLTTILFIIVHPFFNWIHLIVTSFLLASIYAFSGSLKLVIFLHFCANAIFYIDPSIWTK